MKRSPLKRLTGLKRTGGLKRSRPRRPKRRPPWKATSLFRDAVFARDQAAGRLCWGCEVEPTHVAHASCRSQSLLYDAHHLISQQRLRVEFPHGVFLGERDGRPGWLAVPAPGAVVGVPVRSLQELLDDPRNGVRVGRWHHERLELRTAIALRSHLPAAVWEFAGELGLEWLLERTYPVTVTRRLGEAA